MTMSHMALAPLRILVAWNTLQFYLEMDWTAIQPSESEREREQSE